MPEYTYGSIDSRLCDHCRERLNILRSGKCSNDRASAAHSRYRKQLYEIMD